MPACPQCDRTITTDAIRCPHCNLLLKAHGHPGMPLHRAAADTYLCATCTYDADNSCNFPQRPTAITCTLYQDINATSEPVHKPIYKLPWWRKMNSTWLVIAALLAISLLISFF
ncbi:MAG: zinc ribbon domain-containing protein [Cyanobacteria bacterium J06560_6]